MLSIALTSSIRSLPYFSDFKEDRVDVPAKPFLLELLHQTLVPETLTLEDLFSAVETCIYFSLDTLPLLQEMLWKIGADTDTFDQWFTSSSTKSNIWIFDHAHTRPLVDAEFHRTFGNKLDRACLISLGIRCLNPTREEAAFAGNLRLLKWLCETRPEEDSARNFSVCTSAAIKNHLDCLQYAHEQGYPWDENAPIEAAENDSLDCLKYLHEQGCPWDEETCNSAAMYGRLNCLQYAHEQGCPWNKWTCESAAEEGHLDCLKYAHENGCPWDEQTCIDAARGGALNCLKYAHEQGCPWDSQVCDRAARFGHLECLRYAHEQGCPWDDRTCSEAAFEGHLNCLKYAHEQGCPWDDSTVRYALIRGGLPCMEYALKEGCPEP